MASLAPSATAGDVSPPTASSQSPVNEGIQRLLERLVAADARCADAMAVLCRDRAAEIASMPVPVAAALVRSAVEVVSRGLSAGDPSMQTEVLATLGHLLALPSLRDVAVKASRLKSLAIAAIEAALPNSELTRAGDAAAAVLGVLKGAGLDITSAGSLEAGTTPLISAMLYTRFSGPHWCCWMPART
jgi:hypothetical protein